MEKIEFMKVAIDAINGRVEGYSREQANDALRAALLEMNGGSNKINIKNFYCGHALFDLVQEIIPVMIETGLTEDNPLFELIDYRNIALGDVNEFIVEGVNELVVSNVSKGIQGVRRQRLMGREAVRIETELRIIKVFEGLNRLLSGRIAFTDLVNAVSKAYNKQILEDAYVAIKSIGATTPGMNANFVRFGSFDETEFIKLIDRVEAITGKNATIIGTRAALRKLDIDPAVMSERAKSELHAAGFFGTFNGTPCMRLRQSVRKDGTFIMDDNRLWIMASDDKPIKFVNEGDGLLIDHAATTNDDLTQEFVYAQAYGLGVICAAPMGLYNIA